MLAAAGDILDVGGIARIAHRPEHLLVHDVGEADDGVERRAQLMAHIGQELALGMIGLFGSVLFLCLFLDQVGEFVGLPLGAPAAIVSQIR